MYPALPARELGVLLRISQEIDIVGDITAVVSNPPELLAWAATLTDPAVTAWRASGSGSRYAQVSAVHTQEPIRGQITAILHCDHHLKFWQELTEDYEPKAGNTQLLSLADLSRAWQALPIIPPA